MMTRSRTRAALKNSVVQVSFDEPSCSKKIDERDEVKTGRRDLLCRFCKEPTKNPSSYGRHLSLVHYAEDLVKYVR